jgi:hypothetical protein
MPAGLPYFAWVDPTETTFGPEHLRWDESIFSFTLKHDEGDPASLTLVVRRPRNEAGDAIGLLGPGRKIWAWFALDCGPDLVKFRGRLVGVPTSIFEELVTLEFVARPSDLLVQKEALAQTLRVLPYYDEAVIDKARRTDPEVVLEGYSAIWHYDRETHVMTVSDEITGEDGLVEFDGTSEAGKVLYDGLGLTLASGPLARVDVAAEFTWTQLGNGTVDLTNYLVSNSPSMIRGCISSYTLTADSWPKNGASLGDGWVAAAATCFEVYNLTLYTQSYTSTQKVIFGEGQEDTMTTTLSLSNVAFTPPGSKIIGDVITSQFTTSFKGEGMSGSYSRSTTVLPMHHIRPTLLAGYKAQRPCTELVSFSLLADVQHILTDPEDGEALRIDDVKSVNLSEPIGEGTDAYVPIGDARRRSYICTERGNRSLEYLIVLARAHLLKRSRVVEIAFAPKLERMPEITLRKNAFLVEPRVGEALGKVIGYSIALNGADGRIACEVKIGCTIGRGGSAVASGGEPTYCTVDYTGNDYQQFTGRTVLFDTSVGYQPPLSNPNDDGINLLSVLTAEDVIEIPLTVENPDEGFGIPVPQKVVSGPDINESIAAQQQYAANLVEDNDMRLVFKLKSMTREFSSDYAIEVTDLKIPTGYDLEAV